MLKRVIFDQNRGLAYLLLLPQLLVLLVFVFWPAGKGAIQAFLQSDPFGQYSRFVGFDNFRQILSSAEYYNSVRQTVIFSAATTVLSMGTGLLFAIMVNRICRGKSVYKLFIIWPYAIAPVMAGVLWLFLLDPVYGAVALMLTHGFGISWNPLLNGGQAMTLVIIAATWKQIAYNFIFYLAGLQGIPTSLIEAAAIDGAGPVRRFVSIVWPLISPVSFFLAITNMVYAFFDPFGIIQALTQGGPRGATDILVYKVYADGFVGLDLGSSSAQSVILMVLVIGLTVLQFRYVERRVQYGI